MSGDFLQTSWPVLAWVGRTTWEASLIALLVLVAQWVLRGKVSARWRYNLWLLVVARLVLPAVPGSRVSPFNLVRLLPAALERRETPERTPRQTPTHSRPAPLWTVPVTPVPLPGPEVDPSKNLYLVSRPARPVGPRLEGGANEGASTSAPHSVPAPLDVFASVVEAPAAAPAPAPTKVAPPAPAFGTPSQPVSAWSAAPPKAFTSPLPTRPAGAAALAPTIPWFTRVNWPAVVALAWVAGAAFVASRLAWVSFRLARVVAALPPITDPALLSLVNDCLRQLRMTRAPVLLRAPDTFGPALVGLVRPRVLLPDCVIGGGGAGSSGRAPFHRHEVRLILMHELAHMKRRDVAANWLIALLGVLHWFNPVLWLTFRRMRADRELACDELVLSATEDGAAGAYGPTILKLLQVLARGRQPALAVGMVGVLEGSGPADGILARLTNPKSSIRRRFAMIARFDRHQAKHRGASFAGVALTALATAVAFTGAVRTQGASPGPAAGVATASAASPKVAAKGAAFDVMKVVALRHIDSATAAKLATALMKHPSLRAPGRDADATSDQRTNSLLLAGTEKAVDAVTKVMGRLDAEAPAADGRETRIFQLRQSSAVALTPIVALAGVQAVSDDRANSVVVTGAAGAMKAVEAIVAALDVEGGKDADDDKEDKASEKPEEAGDDDRASGVAEALEAAGQKLDAARQQFEEARQSAADRQREARDAANEAREALAEARRQAADQEAEAREAIDQAKQAVAEAKQSAEEHTRELKQELAQARQELVDAVDARERARVEADAKGKSADDADKDADGDDAAEEAAKAAEAAQEQVAERETAIQEAVAAGEEAVREAERALQEVASEKENGIQEARSAIEQAVAQHQEASQAVAEAAQEVASAQASAQQELAAAQQALAEVQNAFKGALSTAAPAAENPAEPREATPPATETAPADPSLPTPPEAPAPETGPVTAAPAATSVTAAVPSAPRPVRALASTTPPSTAAPVAAPATEATPPVAAGSSEPAQPAAVDPLPPSTTPAPAGVGAGPAVVGVAPVPPTPSPESAPPQPSPAAGRVRRGGRGPAAAGGPPGGMGGMMGGYPGMGGGAGGPLTPGMPGMGGMGPMVGMQPGMRPGMPAAGAGMGAGGTGGASAARVEDPESRAADARTAGNLRKPAKIELNDAPLAEALDHVADTAGVDIVTDWRALESVGVNRDTKVSLRLRQDVPAEQILGWVLRSSTGDAAGFAIDRGVVVVSSRDQLDRMVVTRAYDLRNVHTSGNDIEELVRESVSPGSWRQSGGPGSVRVVGGQLFVTATEPNHREVERLLGLIQAQAPEGGAAAPRGGRGVGGGYPGYPGSPGLPGGYGGYPGYGRPDAGAPPQPQPAPEKQSQGRQ